MIQEQLELAGGRTLQKRRGSWVLQPDGLTVDVAVAGDVATITNPDTGDAFTTGITAGGAGRPPRPSVRRKDPAPTEAAGRQADRWAMLNTFTDDTLRSLTAAEARVWIVLFRDVRGGLARAGMTDIARRAGLTRRGVVKAIAGLKRRRLLEVAARGSINGTTNAYRIGGRPA